MSIATSPSSADALPEKSWIDFVADLQDPESAPMLSPVRYIDSLGVDIKTLARNARVAVAAIAETPGAASIQMHLGENLRVIKAAYDVSGNDLLKILRWFRAESLPVFGRMTAEQAVAADRAEDVIRFVHSLHGGAAG